VLIWFPLGVPTLTSNWPADSKEVAKAKTICHRTPLFTVYRCVDAPRSHGAAKQRNTGGNAKLGQWRFPGKADITDLCKDYSELKY